MSDSVTVISLGGSVVHPEGGLAVDFIRDFRASLIDLIDQGHGFVVTVGGGAPSRRQQAVAKELGADESEELDMIGIAALSVHVRLMQAVCKPFVNSTVVSEQFSADIIQNHPLVFVGAESPGSSTDYNAVTAADTLGADRVINITDVGYVYDADPDTHPNATPQEEMSWDVYLDMIPDTFSPGMHLPVGPPAAQKAKQHGITMAVVGGEVSEITAAIMHDDFAGTLLS